MRITKTQLKQIIKEELNVNESPSGEHADQSERTMPGLGTLDPVAFRLMCDDSIHYLVEHALEVGASAPLIIGEIQEALNTIAGQLAADGV